MAPTKRGRHGGVIGGVQVLRGWAALAVVVHHVIEAQYFGAGSALFDVAAVTLGSVGVDIFFVISGVIMMTSSFPEGRSPLTPGVFLMRRIQRIYPLYWAFAAIVLALMAMGVGANQQHDAQTVARSMLLLPSDAVVLSYSWTLHFEVYFYALFAVGLIFADSLRAVFVTTVLLAMMMGLGQFIPDASIRKLLTNPIVFEFALGLVIGFIYIHQPHLFRRWRWAWSAAALAAAWCLAASTWLFPLDDLGPLPEFRFWVWGLPAAILVAWGVGMRLGHGPIARAQTKLGDASYALYLSHYFVATAYWRGLEQFWNFPDVWHLVVGPLVVMICCAVGFLTHAYLEKPLLAMMRGKMVQRPETA